MEKKREKFLCAQKEVKKRYKMYKVKKNWVCTPILFLGIVGGFFISSESVSASELEHPVIEMREQVRNLPSIKTASTEDQALRDTQVQSENLKPNTEIVTKENNETIDKLETSGQKLAESQNKQTGSEDVKTISNKLPNENQKVQVNYPVLYENPQVQINFIDQNEVKEVAKENTDKDFNNLNQEQNNSEVITENGNQKDAVVKNNEDQIRRKRDNLIKVGINSSSTIEVDKETNSKGENGTVQSPYSMDSNIVLNLSQAKILNGGVGGGSSKYIAVDIPKAYQGAITFTEGRKIKVTSTNFPNPGDIIPGLNAVVDTAQTLINAAAKASNHVLESNIDEVVTSLDGLKRLITNTSEVDVPVLSYQVIGNKLEVEISSDGVAKALGENIDKAVKKLANAIENFKFSSNNILGAAAATAANAAINIPKKAAVAALNGIGGVSSVVGN